MFREKPFAEIEIGELFERADGELFVKISDNEALPSNYLVEGEDYDIVH
jgi:hypothetical protein